MSNYELYEDVINGLDKENFSAYARNWIAGAEEAHFEDMEANELFANAKRYFHLWCSNAINSRISKQRMVECVRKIAEKNLPNPYAPEMREYGVDPEQVKIVDDPEAIKGSTVKEEPEHVLGVVPEEKTFFGKRKKR